MVRCPAGVGRWYVAERVDWHWAGLGKAICGWSRPVLVSTGGAPAPGLQHRIKYHDILQRSHACEENPLLDKFDAYEGSITTRCQTTIVHKLAEASH